MQQLPDTFPDPPPWRPRSLPVAREARFSPGKSLLFGAIVAGHVVMLLLWARGMQPQSADATDVTVTEVQFIVRPPVPVPEPDTVWIFPPEDNEKQTSRPAASRSRARTPRPRAVPSLQAVEPSPAKKPLALFDANGRVKLPDGLMADLDAKVGDKRVFDYQVPGLATAGKVFERPPPLVYEHNKFEDYYQPSDGLLNDLLTKMVEGTTKEVRIKIPGNPRAKIVCSVSLLALGGGCAVVQNQGNYDIRDDPDTLSEEEQQQCQAWWDKIVDTRSQDVWRKTRDLYEVECRKPREHKPPVPPGSEPMPGRIEP